ncbi:MAG: DUF2145 domain-containing protein [Xenophilus sp.]
MLLTGFACLPAAHAGRSCEERQPGAAAIARGLELAQRTSQALDASGAKVVVLARVGQDLSRYHLMWSHLGWAYKSAEGPWRVVHKLNRCGTAEAFVQRQGLGEFFLDDPWRYETAWEVPSAQVQQQLWALLSQPAPQLAWALSPVSARPYSVVSYAWGQTYQQSNQWAIEALALAMEPAAVGRRVQAQAWLRFKGYEPSVLRLGPLTRLGGRLGSANVAFDDHPNEKRFSDRIETVTVDSVFDWLPRAGLAAAPVRLKI